MSGGKQQIDLAQLPAPQLNTLSQSLQEVKMTTVDYHIFVDFQTEKLVWM